MLTDGLHAAIARARYDMLDRTNFSWLKLFARSPAHARHALISPPGDTDPKKLGRVVHLAAFEPERFRNAIAVWDGGVRKGKDWEAFKARNEDRELLTENEYAKCMGIQAAVRAHARAMNYLQNGRGEVTLLWTALAPERGREVPAKSRIDFIAQTALVDLKTTRCAKKEFFEKQAIALNYHAQFAFYSDAYFALTGERLPYVVVAVDSEDPFNVEVYRVKERVLERGRATYSAWLDQLVYCRENNVWPGYTAGAESELDLPEYMQDVGDALDLDFGEG